MKDFAVAMNGSFIFVYDMLGLILFLDTSVAMAAESVVEFDFDIV